MRELESVQRPPNWGENLTKATWFGVVVFVVATIYCLVKATAAAGQGSTIGALIMGGLAASCVFTIAALCITVLASAGRYASSDGAGTTVRINPFIAVTYGFGLVGALLSSSSYLVYIDDEAVQALLGRNGTVNRYLMGILLAISVIGLVSMLRTREPGRLRIGPDGVEHADIFRTRSVMWDDIVNITDAADKKSRNPIVLRTKDANPIVVANADRYGSSGPALYWMVRHYWMHPEGRDELTDGRALQRLRDGQFTPE